MMAPRKRANAEAPATMTKVGLMRAIYHAQKFNLSFIINFNNLCVKMARTSVAASSADSAAVTPTRISSKRKPGRKSLQASTDIPALSSPFEAAIKSAGQHLKYAFDMAGQRSREVAAAVHHIVVASRHTILAVPTGTCRCCACTYCFVPIVNCIHYEVLFSVLLVCDNTCDAVAKMYVGTGKSCAFQLLPLVANALNNAPAAAVYSIVLVFAPLAAIMDQQVTFLNGLDLGDIHAIHLLPSSSPDIQQDVSLGRFSHIFVSPETVVGSAAARKFWRAVLAKWGSRLCAIVFDEAHLQLQWGGPFRSSFDRLGQLRSWTQACVLLVTATITNDNLDSLCDLWGISRESIAVVYRPCCCPNIVYTAERRAPEIQEQHADLLERLFLLWMDDPSLRVLVYCRRLEDPAFLTRGLLRKLGTHGYCRETGLTWLAAWTSLFRKLAELAEMESKPIHWYCGAPEILFLPTSPCAPTAKSIHASGLRFLQATKTWMQVLRVVPAATCAARARKCQRRDRGLRKMPTRTMTRCILPHPTLPSWSEYFELPIV